MPARPPRSNLSVKQWDPTENEANMRYGTFNSEKGIKVIEIRFSDYLRYKCVDLLNGLNKVNVENLTSDDV